MNKHIDVNEDSKTLFIRIHELVTRQLTGENETAAMEELSKLLEESDQAKLIYTEYIHETVILRWSGSNGDLDANPQQGVARKEHSAFAQKPRVLYAAAAFLTLAAGIMLVLFLPGGSIPNRPMELAERDSRPGGSPNASSVATLVRTVGVKWDPNYSKPMDFSRLTVGNSLSIERGQMEILFDSGVELVIRGPSRIRVTSKNSIFCERGEISARVGEDATGFTVETSSSVVRDLGTEFGMVIGDSGQAEVAVFDGMVDFSCGSGQPRREVRMYQGEGVKVRRDGMVRRLVSFDSKKFPKAGGFHQRELLQPPIILNVTDNITNEREDVWEEDSMTTWEKNSKKYYQIVRGGFYEDAPAFVDRPHQWNGVDESGIPNELLGAEYLMPFNDNKFIDKVELNVEIGRPADIYILMSDTVVIPDWLTAEFEDTGLAIGLDEGPNRFKPDMKLGIGSGKSIDTLFSIWRKRVYEPGIVKMGWVDSLPASTDGHNMYGIVVTEIMEQEQP